MSNDKTTRSLLESLAKGRLIDMVLDMTVVVRRLEAKVARLEGGAGGGARPVKKVKSKAIKVGKARKKETA